MNIKYTSCIGETSSQDRKTKMPKPKSKPIPDVCFQKLPKNQLECPVCHSMGQLDWASAYPSDVKRFRMGVVYYCTGCGSGHVIDGDRLLENYYPNEYATSNRKDRHLNPKNYFENLYDLPKLKRYFNRAEAQISSLRSYGASFKRVLDYGSGPGYLLYTSKAKEPYAVEFDKESDKYLKYLGAIKLNPNELPENFFDVIVASHVVEHFTLTNLHINLINMVRALKKNSGLILVEVPQGGHSYLKLEARQDPHTLFFTPEGIYSAVKKANADIVAAYPRGIPEVEEHPHKIYTPTLQDKFFKTRKGGLTVIAKRP